MVILERSLPKENRRKLFKWAKNVRIIFSPAPPLGELRRQCEIELRKRGELNCSPTDKRVLNVLRHVYSNYDELVNQLKRMTDDITLVNEGSKIIRQRVNETYGTRYGLPCSFEVTGDHGRYYN